MSRADYGGPGGSNGQTSKEPGSRVELIVDLLAAGWTQEQILDSYPNLTLDDIRACLAYAGELLHAENVFPLR